jgi:DNA-binding CsgD family transcriptional regulator
VSEIAHRSLKILGFTGSPSQVPLGFAIAARASEVGVALELSLGAEGLERVHVPEQGAWLEALSRAEQEAVLGLLRGETREAIATRRDTSPRTVANQLMGAFRKLNVSTVAELRALAARLYVEETPSTLGFSGLARVGSPA